MKKLISPVIGHCVAARLLPVASVIGLIGIGHVVVATSSAAVPSTQPAPTVLSGHVPAGADVLAVQLLAAPSDAELRRLPAGSAARLVKVSPEGVTTHANRFSVAFTPADAPASTIDAHGLAFLQVVVHTTAGDFVTSTSLRAVASRTSASRWAAAEAPTTRTGGMVRTSRIGRRHVAVVNAVPTRPVALDHFRAVAQPGFAQRSSGDDPWNPWSGCTWVKRRTTVRPATIGTTYPVAGDTASMDVDSSSGASYGVAISTPDRDGSWSKFTISNAKHTESGWGFEWAASANARSYRKGIQYGLFDEYCTTMGCNQCQAHRQRAWYPIGETGGTGSNTKGVTRPNWTKCAPVDPGKWWRDRTDGFAYTYGSSVKMADVIGIDLSISRQYNHSQKLEYILHHRRRMCGNNSYPAKAGKVMERL